MEGYLYRCEVCSVVVFCMDCLGENRVLKCVVCNELQVFDFVIVKDRGI